MQILQGRCCLVLDLHSSAVDWNEAGSCARLFVVLLGCGVFTLLSPASSSQVAASAASAHQAQVQDTRSPGREARAAQVGCHEPINSPSCSRSTSFRHLRASTKVRGLAQTPPHAPRYTHRSAGRRPVVTPPRCTASSSTRPTRRHAQLQTMGPAMGPPPAPSRRSAASR